MIFIFHISMYCPAYQEVAVIVWSSTFQHSLTDTAHYSCLNLQPVIGASVLCLYLLPFSD